MFNIGCSCRKRDAEAADAEEPDAKRPAKAAKSADPTDGQSAGALASHRPSQSPHLTTRSVLLFGSLSGVLADASMSASGAAPLGP